MLLVFFVEVDGMSALSLVYFVEVDGTSAFSLTFSSEIESESSERALLFPGLGNLSRMTFGAKGYIPAQRIPNTILLMVIPFDQA